MASCMHNVEITLGGVVALKELLPHAGWYKGKPLPLSLAAIDLVESLSDPAVFNTDFSGLDADARTAKLRESVTVVMNERQREACKACVTHFHNEGALLLTVHTGTLIRALGLDS